MARVSNTGGAGFTVDNGTGLVVRTKLNEVIAALSTLSQGSGTPTIGLAAYTPFIDGNTLKIQNSGNSAAVTLGDVSLTNFGHANLAASNTFAAATIFNDTNNLLVSSYDFYGPKSMVSNASTTPAMYNNMIMPSEKVPYVIVRDNVCLVYDVGDNMTSDTILSVRLECAQITLDQATLNQLLRTQTV